MVYPTILPWLVTQLDFGLKWDRGKLRYPECAMVQLQWGRNSEGVHHLHSLNWSPTGDLFVTDIWSW